MIVGHYTRGTPSGRVRLTITEIGHNSYSLVYDANVLLEYGVSERGWWQCKTSLQRESMFYSNGFYRLQLNIYRNRILIYESGYNIALSRNIKLGGTYVRGELAADGLHQRAGVEVG